MQCYTYAHTANSIGLQLTTALGCGIWMPSTSLCVSLFRWVIGVLQPSGRHTSSGLCSWLLARFIGQWDTTYRANNQIDQSVCGESTMPPDSLQRGTGLLFGGGPGCPPMGGQPGSPTEELSPWRGGGVPVFDREVEKVRAEGSPRRALQKNVEMRNLGQGDIFVVLNEGFQMSPLATRMPVLSRTCSVRNPAYLSTANTDLSGIFVIVVPNRI